MGRDDGKWGGEGRKEELGRRELEQGDGIEAEVGPS